MSIVEYIYNIISIICLIDFIICKIQIAKNAFMVLYYGLNNITKIKLMIDKLIIVVYVFYIIYKLIHIFI